MQSCVDNQAAQLQFESFNLGVIKMAKGQQSNKMVKKPKKDTAPPKVVSPDAVRPTVTTVVPVRGKLKNAPTKG